MELHSVQTVDVYWEKGNYKVPFTANNLPSGYYLYQLLTGEYRAVREMGLLK
jgi:hypothetical protein